VAWQLRGGLRVRPGSAGRQRSRSPSCAGTRSGPRWRQKRAHMTRANG